MKPLSMGFLACVVATTACALPHAPTEHTPEADTAVRVTFDPAYAERIDERDIAVRSVVGRVVGSRSGRLLIEVTTAVRERGGRTRGLSGLVIPVDMEDAGVRVVVLNSGSQTRDAAVVGAATGLVFGVPLLFTLLWAVGCGNGCT